MIRKIRVNGELHSIDYTALENQPDIKAEASEVLYSNIEPLFSSGTEIATITGLNEDGKEEIKKIFVPSTISSSGEGLGTPLEIKYVKENNTTQSQFEASQVTITKETASNYYIKLNVYENGTDENYTVCNLLFINFENNIYYFSNGIYKIGLHTSLNISYFKKGKTEPTIIIEAQVDSNNILTISEEEQKRLNRLNVRDFSSVGIHLSFASDDGNEYKDEFLTFDKVDYYQELDGEDIVKIFYFNSNNSQIIYKTVDDSTKNFTLKSNDTLGGINADEILAKDSQGNLLSKVKLTDRVSMYTKIGDEESTKDFSSILEYGDDFNPTGRVFEAVDAELVSGISSTISSNITWGSIAPITKAGLYACTIKRTFVIDETNKHDYLTGLISVPSLYSDSYSHFLSSDTVYGDNRLIIKYSANDKYLHLNIEQTDENDYEFYKCLLISKY